MDRNTNRAPIYQENHVRGSELFIGGLSRSTTESTIREIFSPCGKIVDLRMMQDQNGIPKGFCFVRFATKEAALKAQKEKDGIMLHGKKIGVAPSSDKDSLFFGNLRKEWSPGEFDKLVHQAFKDVVSVDLAMASGADDTPSGRRRQNRGFAFVQFSNHAAAARAYRVGSKADFLLDDDWHPVIDWAEKEPEIDPSELAKIKSAFVGNLPANADEDFLMKLFGQVGKVERVALSRKGRFPVGFVHFANRSDLDNAIKEMDGTTVQGPHRGPNFKIQVSIAKPVEHDRKRVHDEVSKPLNWFGNRPDSLPLNKAGVRSDFLKDRYTCDSLDRKSKAPRLANVVTEPLDPYEETVIQLPPAVKERLLRVLRLGVATRYDVDIHCITSLKELPESAAVAVLDQFLLSGADKRDKGAYFASLVDRYQVEKLGLRWNSSHLARSANDFTLKDSEQLNLRVPLHTQGIDHSTARYSGYPSSASRYRYSPPVTDDPPLPRSSLGKYADSSPSYREPISSTLGYRTGTDSSSRLPSSADHPPQRTQMRFDPFTGQPYKFDPFTGEPIRPESHAQRSTNLF